MGQLLFLLPKVSGLLRLVSSFANSQCGSNSVLGATPCDTFEDMN